MESAAAAEAKALLASGRASEAAALLEAALAQSPRWGRGWLLLGQARAREGDNDGAAVAFRRAGGDCKDASPALTLVAQENLQLCSARILPRHALAWLNDAAREEAWACALRAALTARPRARVLCAGATSACAALHAALAVAAGAREAVAVCGCRLVAETGAAPDAVRLEARLPLAQAFRAEVVCWDVGNCLSTSSLATLRAARAECAELADVLPRAVRVKCCVVECDAIAELNAVAEVRVRAADVVAAGGTAALTEEDAVFSFEHFRAGFERSSRAVQLQAASTRPWRALSETVTLLHLDTACELDSDAPTGAWVDASALSDGRGHAVLSWLEVDLGGGAVLSTAPPELAPPGCSAGPLTQLHCTQHATFAAAPWAVQKESVLRLRATVTPDGIRVELSPNFPCAGGSSAAASVPDYHASMLNDTRRNAAYLSGIRAAFQQYRDRHPGAAPRVLDIGAGAGLLSMMAASAGAAKVVACERDAGLAAAACADVEANGFGDIVTMVGAHSRELCDENVGQFDFVVSEIFGSDALSESVLPTLAHAQAALLKPGGTMIPGKLVVRAALACSGALRLHSAAAGNTPLDRLRHSFDALAPLRCSAHLPDDPGTQLLTTVGSFELDLNARPLATCGSLEADVVATAPGEADCVAYWFDVVFSDGGAHVATGPEDGRRAHWMQTLFRLAPRALRTGECLRLQLDYQQDRTMFKLAREL